MLLLGKDADLQEIQKALEQIFAVTDLGEPSLFLGFAIRWDKGKGQVELSQKAYAKDVLQRLGMADAKPARTPLCPGMKLMSDEGEADSPQRDFQSAVGSLNYLATGTRPDLAFAVGTLSRFLSAPKRSHWANVQHVCRYLKGTVNTVLTLGRDKTGNCQLAGYTDADWGANDESRRSISGTLYTLWAGCISWSSKRQKTVALSSTEAEYLALTRATKEALWLQRLLGEIEGKTRGPVQIHVDNMGCIAMAKNPEGHERSKHIDIQAHFVRHYVGTQRIQLSYCPTEEMKAGFLTKGLPRIKHEWCVNAVGLRNNEGKGPPIKGE